jgi:hypothetical protein
MVFNVLKVVEQVRDSFRRIQSKNETFFSKIEKFKKWSIFDNFSHILWSKNHVLKKVGRTRDVDLFSIWCFLNLHNLGYPKSVTFFCAITFGLTSPSALRAILCCSSARQSHAFDEGIVARLARHFKTDPTETVALIFGYAKTLCWRRRHCGLARHFKTDPTETVALIFGYAKTLCWRRRHCGLARHFKTDPTKTLALIFGYAKTLCWWRRHCGLARHFKTDSNKTVALCFGYAKTLKWQADDKQMNRTWDRSSLFWIREDTWLTTKALWPGASFQNRSY